MPDLIGNFSNLSIAYLLGVSFRFVRSLVLVSCWLYLASSFVIAVSSATLRRLKFHNLGLNADDLL